MNIGAGARFVDKAITIEKMVTYRAVLEVSCAQLYYVLVFHNVETIYRKEPMMSILESLSRQSCVGYVPCCKDRSYKQWILRAHVNNKYTINHIYALYTVHILH
jgi:hypothetical protein